MAKKTIVFYASGFRGYPTTLKGRKLEIERCEASQWFPMTPDFRATASMTKWGYQSTYGVSSFVSLLNRLNRFRGTIQRIVIIGHGSSSNVAFSGSLQTPTNKLPFVTFNSSGVLGTSQLATNKNAIGKIRSKLDAKAQIDLVCCGGHKSSTAIMRPLAKAFQATVRGFQRGLAWTLDYDDPAPKKPYKIKRGRIENTTVGTTLGPWSFAVGTHKLKFETIIKP